MIGFDGLFHYIILMLLLVYPDIFLKVYKCLIIKVLRLDLTLLFLINSIFLVCWLDFKKNACKFNHNNITLHH